VTAGVRGVPVVGDAGVDVISTIREFWRVVLGYVHAPDSRFTDLYDPRQLNPVVFFQPMDATENERRRQRNRIHVELLMPSDQLQTRVDAAVAAGGRILEQERSPDRYRLADPEGNEVVLRAVARPAGSEGTTWFEPVTDDHQETANKQQ
jgi:hypothetical protein